MEENDDAFLVVAEAYCRYKAPAYYDDELLVRTHVTELRRRSLRFGYEIIRVPDDQIIAEGETGHVVTDATGRVRSFPEGYAQRLLSPPIIKSPSSGEKVPAEEGPKCNSRQAPVSVLTNPARSKRAGASPPSLPERFSQRLINIPSKAFPSSLTALL